MKEVRVVGNLVDMGGNRVGGGHRFGIDALTCDGLIILGNDLRGNDAALHVGTEAVVGQNLE